MAMRKTNLRFERFEDRRLLTSVIFEPHHVDLTSPGTFIQARAVFAADFDGDGDVDLASASSNENLVAWHENVDGTGTFRSRQDITDQATRSDLITAADLDNDGDLDILFGSSREDTIAWITNLGGGNFGQPQTISTTVDQVRSIAADDIDGDGDTDILSASAADDTVAWYENTDGGGTFGDQQIITAQADGAMSVHTADVDGDGDVDVLSASPNDDVVAWYENQDGQGFSEAKLISSPDPTNSRSNFVGTADLDGDGDLDVLVSSFKDDLVSWHENTNGQGAFGPEQVIMTGVFRPFPRVDTVHAADFDRDGDLDIITASEFNHEIYLAENLDGRGTFGERQLSGPSTELAGAVSIADIDGDGDTDIVAASDHEGLIAWHENRRIGDSNNDGVFNTRDFVRIFEAGQYLDDETDNSTFDEGDWNLDGDFDTSDLVFAFEAGTYFAPLVQSRPSIAWAAADVVRTIEEQDARSKDDAKLAFVP